MLQIRWLLFSIFVNHSNKILLKKRSNKRYSNWQVLSVLVVYVFVVLTYILFLQQQHCQSTKSVATHSSFFKRKETSPSGDTSLLHRLDKSILDFKKVTLNAVSCTFAVGFLFSIVFSGVFRKLTNFYLHFINIRNNRKSFRLLLCSLQIWFQHCIIPQAKLFFISLVIFII